MSRIPLTAVVIATVFSSFINDVAAQRPQNSFSSFGAAVVFEPNVGQFDPEVLYAARTRQQTVWIVPEGLVITTQVPDDSGRSTHVTASISFLDASLAGHRGSQPVPCRLNYYRDSDPKFWRSGVPLFTKLHFESLWSGVDLVMYERQGTLEFDLSFSPGVSVDVAQLEVKGDDVKAALQDGRLVVSSGKNIIAELSPPATFEQFDGEKKSLPSRFKRLRDRVFGFEVSGRDITRHLVIDPLVTIFSTYAGNATQRSSQTGFLQPPSTASTNFATLLVASHRLDFLSVPLHQPQPPASSEALMLVRFALTKTASQNG